MTSEQPAKEHIDAVHRYLVQALPGEVHRTGWEEEARAQICALTDGAVLRHVVSDGGLCQACPDCAAALRNSELADSMRETRAPTRCFHLTWEAGVLHIRSKPL